ncbi:M48 family metalloprotease [Ottowia testudinis]|uniref:M48 family metalloprotease n=2 Tax=Ottowia testudinis TaxID=2816950 RepID=A0A975H7M8_9BURK|nr:M48 family metalloprotease [Ottowia testudinis]
MHCLCLTRRQATGLFALAFLPLHVAGQSGEPAGGARAGLPSLGDAGAMTPLEERKLGDAIIRELYRDPDYIDDPVVGEYVDGIWRRLLAGARVRGELPAELDERYAWAVLLGRDRSINAFALPGGYFGLHLGLVGAVASRDELASVLAHEMTHITQRHIPRLLGQQSRQAPLMLAAMVLGAIAASKNPQAGAALAVGGQAAVIQQQLNFSRDMEREADRIGYGVMTQAGYAPQGFAGMFEKLQSASRINDNGDWPYLRSHPLTTQRIADMQQRQQSQPRQVQPADLEALLVAARARVLGRPGVDVLRAWMAEPAQPGFAALPLPRRAAALYAAALAEAQLRDLPKAEALAAQLAPLVAGDAQAARQARLLQAELALQSGQPARALQLLPSMPRAAAGDVQGQSGRAVLLLRAQAQTQNGQAAQAVGTLQTWVSDHPGDAGAWQALAQAHAALGQTLRALRAEGEVPMAHMDYAGAVDRWRAAQDFSRQHPGGAADQIDANIIDTRLRLAQEALQQQRLEDAKRR